MFHHLECDALDHSAIQAPGDKNGKTEGDEEAESKNSILRVSRDALKRRDKKPGKAQRGATCYRTGVVR